MVKINGWIKLHRELMDKPIWLNSTLEQRVILITLLCMANHEPKKWEWKGKPYEVQAGQFITSLPSIVKKCKCKEITTQKVRTALERFEKLEFLTDKSTNKNRLITILNWEFYQNCTTDDNSQNNRHLTGTQQALNRHLTANKNIKNDKNIYMCGQKDHSHTQDSECASRQQGMGVPIQDSKGTSRKSVENSKRFIIPSVAEVQAYCDERGNNINAERFVDYYNSIGWKVGNAPMKDWRATVRNWERNKQPVASVKSDKFNKFNNYNQPDYSQKQWDEIMARKAKANEL